MTVWVLCVCVCACNSVKGELCSYRNHCVRVCDAINTLQWSVNKSHSLGICSNCIKRFYKKWICHCSFRWYSISSSRRFIKWKYVCRTLAAASYTLSTMDDGEAVNHRSRRKTRRRRMERNNNNNRIAHCNGFSAVEMCRSMREAANTHWEHVRTRWDKKRVWKQNKNK